MMIIRFRITRKDRKPRATKISPRSKISPSVSQKSKGLIQASSGTSRISHSLLVPVLMRSIINSNQLFMISVSGGLWCQSGSMLMRRKGPAGVSLWVRGRGNPESTSLAEGINLPDLLECCMTFYFGQWTWGSFVKHHICSYSRKKSFLTRTSIRGLNISVRDIITLSTCLPIRERPSQQKSLNGQEMY